MLTEITSSISSLSSRSSRQSVSGIPDGGYGWIITFASFMCHFVADGIAFTFGVVYTNLLTEFQSSKSATSWVGSLFVGVPLICGPVAGLFVNKYGCRISTIFGGLISACGLLLSSYATSVEMLSVSYGIIAGFGLAFVYVPASVIPSFWFEKKRSLATGIAVSGSGIGTFAMAPFMEYLIDEYGWRGALLVLSGVTLNIVVFGALFRSIPDMEDNCDTDGTPSTVESKCVISKNNIEDIFSTHDNRIEKHTHADTENCGNASTLHMNNNVLMMHHSMNTIIQGHQLEDMDEIDGKRYIQSCTSINQSRIVPVNQLYRSTRSLLPLSRRDISSVLSLAQLQRRMSSCPDLSTVAANHTATHKSKDSRFLKSLSRLANEMCDVRLFKVPVYSLFFVSNFLLSYAYDLPYVYLPDYADDLKIPNSSFLISIIGIINMFGQILYGFLGDQKRINTLLLYGGSIVVCGGLITSLPLMTSFTPLAAFSTLFGLFISANFSLETIVVVNILSLEQLTKAYSLLMFGQGMASLIGPPIGGFLWDLTKSYTFTFIFAGASMILSGILVLSINVLMKKRSLNSLHITSVTVNLEAGLN